ncbi:unnamed protein product, partial [Vitis vinifera]|uniref:Uncharacterized protein n=1 Tax=Vitis vinifera TaxID=29760 RepID=D7TB02_VITVI
MIAKNLFIPMHDDCPVIGIFASLTLKTLISKFWIHCDQGVGMSFGLRVSKQWLNFVKHSSNCMT